MHSLHEGVDISSITHQNRPCLGQETSTETDNRRAKTECEDHHKSGFINNLFARATGYNISLRLACVTIFIILSTNAIAMDIVIRYNLMRFAFSNE